MALVELRASTARWLVWIGWMLLWSGFLYNSLEADAEGLGETVIHSVAGALSILWLAAGVIWAAWQLNNRFDVIRVDGAVF